MKKLICIPLALMLVLCGNVEAKTTKHKSSSSKSYKSKSNKKVEIVYIYVPYTPSMP
jgi:hypothetical protein